MRKRISCKVIRTIPLRPNIDELRDKIKSNNRSHNINNNHSTPKINKCFWETTTNPEVKDFSKSVVYTHRMNLTSIPIDNGLKSLNLNFYA